MEGPATQMRAVVISRICGRRVFEARRLQGCGAANDKVHVAVTPGGNNLEGLRPSNGQG